MPTLLSSISKHLRRAYEKAEEFIEEEREIPVSQVFLNATFKRYVTDNLSFLDDLHADVYEGWLRLYATLHFKGLSTTLSVDLKLIQMELNKDTQLLVFEQISDTQVVEAKFKNTLQKIAFNSYVFFYHKILRKDPLGPILERFEVVKVKDELLFLDLNRWLGKNRSVIDALSKVHVNHAQLKEAELVVLGNVNFMALFNKGLSKPRDQEDAAEEELELAETTVTPIRQKNE
ncbi:hypothetical protein [Acinetobacter ursingii]|uniref:hypothetical protein n=1 Tax=Acinetobacter ursingii TaxID=108980 RepID=UPI000CC9ACC5|nr:hypothetical protein [Acinetobacter ursingii]MCU4352416.1 hypothetical protein [Acinetobacter ursingii]MDI3237381.1 hypothetical protein [Acinetobacter ursingii]PMC95574.1 hypothetical protein CJ183_16345 [Acinetobacter ursingii]